jgi:hypothetical protein
MSKPGKKTTESGGKLSVYLLVSSLGMESIHFSAEQTLRFPLLSLARLQYLSGLDWRVSELFTRRSLSLSPALAGFLFGLFFDPEESCYICFRIVGLFPNYDCVTTQKTERVTGFISNAIRCI